MKKIGLIIIGILLLLTCGAGFAADKPVSQFTAATTIADDDLLMISYYNAGVFYSRKLTFANFKAKLDTLYQPLDANTLKKAGDLTTGQRTCGDENDALVSCGANVDGFTSMPVRGRLTKKDADEIIEEIGAGDYDTVASAATGTGNINIDGISYADYNYSNGASAATYTYVITSAPAAGKVRYITLTIGGGAGVVTSVWDNITWIGTAGAATTTTNKKSTYACIIRNTGSQCKIVAEAY